MSNPTFINPSQFQSSISKSPTFSTNPTREIRWTNIFSNEDTSIRDITSTAEKHAYNDDLYLSYIRWKAPDTREAASTNLTFKTAITRLVGLGAARLGQFTGIPQITQGVQNLLTSGPPLSATYSTLPFDQLRPAVNLDFDLNTGLTVNDIKLQGSPVKYADFRSRISYSTFKDTNLSTRISNLQLNGASSALLGSATSILYAGASASPFGAYSVINLETWYGWGEHDDRNAIRTDFTAKSHVTTRWNKRLGWQKVGINAGSIFKRPTAAAEIAMPFRGDKVSVIDFSQRKLNNTYQWNPVNNILGAEIRNPLNENFGGDFIKFYLTGPKLAPGSDEMDDIIVFRAAITTLGDSFSADWTAQNMIGRADPNYHYGGFGRTLSLGFDIYATDRDEVKPIWRKLNALAGYTAPIYDGKTIAMKAPWMRITIGDLFTQVPVTLTSLGYDYGLDAPWEINIERDPEMMQVPLKISVQCGFNVIANDIPQFGGRFFGLAKRYDEQGFAIQGTDNWLSDFKPNAPDSETFESQTNVTRREAKRAAKQQKQLADKAKGN